MASRIRYCDFGDFNTNSWQEEEVASTLQTREAHPLLLLLPPLLALPLSFPCSVDVDRGYHTPISSENHPNLGSKPIFRTTTSINSQVERSAPLWSRTQSAPHFQELQPFAISNSSSGLDPMEEEWIQSRRKGNGSEMDSISASSSQSGEMMMDENQPIGVSNGPIQVKRGREFGEADRDDVLGRWAEEDGG